LIPKKDRYMEAMMMLNGTERIGKRPRAPKSLCQNRKEVENIKIRDQGQIPGNVIYNKKIRGTFDTCPISREILR